MHRLLKFQGIESAAITLVGVASAYFDSTITFMIALGIAFLFNILAGFRADEVKFTMWRLVNFKGNKFKDSLNELFLIVVVTYLIKSLMDLMKMDDKSAYAVQILVWIALYYYIRNACRNLSKAYTKVKWLRVVYHLISFKFKELMPSGVADAIEATEKEVGNEDK